MVAFWFVVSKTALGRAQRACEQDQKMAALLGIDVDRTISITFVIGAALAAVAGTMYVIYYGVISFADGFTPGVKAFTAAVLGGIGSLPGAVVGGLLIGLIETFWSAYFTTDYKDVAAFSILAITLIFMPQGCSAGRTSRRCDGHAGRRLVMNASEPRASTSPQAGRGSEAPCAIPRTAALSAPLPRALKDAAFAALLSLGLFCVGRFDTVTNIRNELILQTRFGLLAVMIALIAAASLVNSLVVAPWRARRALAEPQAGRQAVPASSPSGFRRSRSRSCSSIRRWC